MPSQAMQDVIDALRDRQEASASQAPPTPCSWPCETPGKRCPRPPR